jgi:hypothetical protein
MTRDKRKVQNFNTKKTWHCFKITMLLFTSKTHIFTGSFIMVTRHCPFLESFTGQAVHTELCG